MIQILHNVSTSYYQYCIEIQTPTCYLQDSIAMETFLLQNTRHIFNKRFFKILIKHYWRASSLELEPFMFYKELPIPYAALNIIQIWLLYYKSCPCFTNPLWQL